MQPPLPPTPTASPCTICEGTGKYLAKSFDRGIVVRTVACTCAAAKGKLPIVNNPTTTWQTTSHKSAPTSASMWKRTQN